MGRAKDEWMRQNEEGWRSVGNKQVCSKCVSERAIARFIRKNATSNECSYCGRRTKIFRAYEMDKVLSFIAKGLLREFEDPAHNVGYESREGGYQIEPHDAEDLFGDLGLSDSNEDFYEDLCSAFSDSRWVKQDPYGMRYSEVMISLWDRFSHQVKHETRFMFAQVEVDLSDELGYGYSKRPHDILQSLGDVVERLGLIKTLKKGSKFVRARPHSPQEQPTAVGEIAPLTPEKSFAQNRFSPAGVSMFYAAEDEKTAFLETIRTEATERSLVSYGRFRARRPLLVLDLSEDQSYPSIFDPERAHLRIPVEFLNHFVNTVRQPVDPSASSISYVPTQVVAEYFRHVFRFHGDSLDGIIYRSSRRGGGLCFTLFLGPEHCGERSDETAILRLMEITSRSVDDELRRFRHH